MTLVHPVKPFKNPALVLVGDANAGISHRYGRSPRTPRHRNGDTAACLLYTSPVQIQRIAESVELQCQKIGRAPTVEEIQDMVEHYIMAHGAFEVAKHYITYRYTRSLVRKSNTTDDKILSLIECNNEAVSYTHLPAQDGRLPAG